MPININELIPEWAREFYGKRLRNLTELFGVDKPIIGMVHLMPLPGSPAYNGWDMNIIIEAALRDAKALIEGGVDGLIVENMWDLPYYAGSKNIPPEEIAAHAVAAREVVKSVNVPVGITVIHNGGRVALGIAKASGAKFIRVCLYTGALVWDTGEFDHGNAAELMRLRKLLYAEDIKFFADVYKKHAVMFPGITPEVHAIWTDFYLADALIVTGLMTGIAPEVELVKRVKSVVKDVPVIIGSGVNLGNVRELLRYADGAIVGTYFKVNGITQNPVDPERVKKLMRIVKELRKTK
ncbi:MAG: photosystem I assembly BtpA [Desulfurococcales archaeon ex4484_42]|nr:MAG: photosystem I assembly BtpA [Desulfurococcales archaeon ex4484_42]